ncbi:hypothetical protein HMP0721_1232 [Pseudoramibacter alactolyticus ATCC 23263]|uniref:Uncharacterized protein n=1 Tax=Pseudoramibacter alactolyticus ATCC 23263 TaxID=887929 RepID=E6MGU9_9FIRM|nr:hypothetical protein [Pseudoramibacter alactolyticus]EFV01839.1 hypothetical protein HMP0721_1232 [Pseudoramibacter alactolyticus ATCC 23263]
MVCGKEDCQSDPVDVKLEKVVHFRAEQMMRGTLAVFLFVVLCGAV